MLRQQINEHLESVIGETIWSAVEGPQGDYVLSLELGARRPRSMRLANPRLSFLKSTYEGEYGFLIECPWRIDAPDRVVVSYLGVLGQKDPPPADRIDVLEGLTVMGIHAEPPVWDLTVRLSEGYVLRCFSAEVDVGRKRGNWSLWSPEGPLQIGPAGRVKDIQASDRRADLRRRLQAVEDEDDA